MKPIDVFLMDSWCAVPFYNRYLCEALRAEGVRITLGSTSFHLEPDYFRRHGLRNDPGLLDIVARLRIKEPKMRRALRFLEFCGNLAALAFRFGTSKPDIIHVQWIPLVEEGLPFEIWFLLWAKRQGIKLVYTVHNVLPHDTGNRLRESYRRVYLLVDALVCHTEDAKNRLMREFSLPSERIWVIPHGPLFHDYPRPSVAEARARLGFSNGQCVVLFQGLIRPYKGTEFLLEAWKEIEKREPAARLLIVGHGERQWLRRLEARVDSLALRGSAALKFGYLPSSELPAYYQAADVVVYPYEEVTQSGALLTGLAFGKPIVATALPGFREVLRDCPSASFVRYGDTAGLADAILTLIRQPVRRDALAGEIARHWQNDEGWGGVGQRTRRCYESVLAIASSVGT